jgi:syntaxin-binding protein 1
MLRQIGKEKILEILDQVKLSEGNRLSVLILDGHTCKIVSSMATTYDILKRGVSLIEMLALRREPLPKLEAVYIVSPTRFAVTRIIDDFDKRRKDKRCNVLRYPAAHIFFTGSLAPELLEMLAKSVARRHIKALCEVSLHFYVHDSRVFKLGMADAFGALYASSKKKRARCRQNEEHAQQRLIAEQQRRDEQEKKKNEKNQDDDQDDDQDGDDDDDDSDSSDADLYSEVEQIEVSIDSNNVIDELCDRLASVCATMGEWPGVRCSAGDDVARAVAEGVSQRLDAMHERMPDFPKRAFADDNRSVLLVVNRSVDALAPLLHEFSYCALAYDVVPELDADRQTLERQYETGAGAIANETVLIDESDPLWRHYRTRHWQWIQRNLPAQFREFTAANQYTAELHKKGAQQQQQQALDREQFAELSPEEQRAQLKGLRSLRDAAAGLRKYQDMASKYGIHLGIATDCSKAIARRGLVELARFEQDMATGQLGKKKDAGRLLVAAVAKAAEQAADGPGPSELDKARALAIFAVSQPDVSAARIDELAAELGVASQGLVRAVKNIAKLGVKLGKPFVRSAPPLDWDNGGAAESKGKGKKKKGGFAKKRQRVELPDVVSRYTPALHDIVEQLTSQALPRKPYPPVGDYRPPVLSSASKSSTAASSSSTDWARDRKSQRPSAAASSSSSSSSSSSLPRIIVFVIGGITNAEIAIVHRLAEQFRRDIYLGSTHILTPTSFIEQLRHL